MQLTYVYCTTYPIVDLRRPSVCHTYQLFLSVCMQFILDKNSSVNFYYVLDMSQAYHQVPIAEDSQKYLTINIHCGLFQFTLMPNGIHSGPALDLFHRTMDSLLSRIPGVTCYLDDILVTGKSAQEHYQNLASVFEKLQSAGFNLNKSKRKFEQSLVTYLGHIIDEKGLHPTHEKLDAIHDAPAPKMYPLSSRLWVYSWVITHLCLHWVITHLCLHWVITHLCLHCLITYHAIRIH